jgi:hypothetical protein
MLLEHEKGSNINLNGFAKIKSPFEPLKITLVTNLNYSIVKWFKNNLNRNVECNGGYAHFLNDVILIQQPHW